jgi:hypothetical protein
VYEWSERGYINKTNALKGQKVSLEPFNEIVFDIDFLFGE